MLGAIIGDIVGSIYEHNNIKTKDFPLFAEGATFTDDTVCTVAIADGLLSGGDFVDHLRTWVRRYPHAGYGGMFLRWAFADGMGPYGSWGNGSAMGAARLLTPLRKSKRRCSWPSDPPS
jgi:ADP-ribosylglycohydrolase